MEVSEAASTAAVSEAEVTADTAEEEAGGTEEEVMVVDEGSGIRVMACRLMAHLRDRGQVVGMEAVEVGEATMTVGRGMLILNRCRREVGIGIVKEGVEGEGRSGRMRVGGVGMMIVDRGEGIDGKAAPLL